jgi:hypothetical protein
MMKQNWFLQKLETSQTFRFSFEIVIAIVLFSWLPLVFQIIAGLILSVVFEMVFAKILTNNLKNKFSGETLSQILNNTEKR